MRIVLRTSGGRGEYEIAGTQGSISAIDLINHKIILSLLPNYLVNTANIISHVQGKPRIRLERDGKNHKHAYLIISDLLLLPKPKREIGTTPNGKLQLIDNKFSITSIELDIISISDDNIIVYPTNLILSNGDDTARIDILERMRIIINLWEYAENNDTQFSKLILEHKKAFLSGDENYISIVANEIKRNISQENDPLRQILINLCLINNDTYWMGLHNEDTESFIIENSSYSIKEASLSIIKKWRLQSVRGKDAINFSKNIKICYNNTCLFTGYYLPKTEIIDSSGVDAAHILPWANYNLNSISNGICLNKLCHWAFDNGIIRLNYDRLNNRYYTTIPDKHLSFENERKIDLTPFRNICGIIPEERLPLDKNLWPNPDYINKYNSIMDNIL